MNELQEARYHFALSEVIDMIRLYGYCNVVNDIDAMIADEIDRKMKVAYEPAY